MHDLENTFEGKEAEVPAESVNTETINTVDGENLEELIESLSPEDIEKISGGFIRHELLRVGERWVVYDDKTLEPIGRYNTKEEAIRQAVLSGNSPEQLNTFFGGFYLKRLRKDAANGNRDCVNKDFSKKEETDRSPWSRHHFLH